MRFTAERPRREDVKHDVATNEETFARRSRTFRNVMNIRGNEIATYVFPRARLCEFVPALYFVRAVNPKVLGNSTLVSINSV